MASSKFIVPIILFFLTVAAGFWVSKTGKPYNTGIFTLHKLLALAAVVLAAMVTTNLLKTTSTQPINVNYSHDNKCHCLICLRACNDEHSKNGWEHLAANPPHRAVCSGRYNPQPFCDVTQECVKIVAMQPGLMICVYICRFHQ